MVHLIISFRLSCIVLGSLVGKVRNQDTFSAFTAGKQDPELKELEQMYQELRNEGPHQSADIRADVENKIRVCQSIMSSGHFRTSSFKSINMDNVYPELKMSAIRRMQNTNSPVHEQHEIMRQDYELKTLSRSTFRTRSTHFTLSTGQEVEENAFACARRIFQKNRDGNLTPFFILYFISDPYNISPTPDTDDGQLRVRFVCEVQHGVCDLCGVAEQPALAFPRSEYFVERVYLRMRDFYNAAQLAHKDPLCQMTTLEKLRVCVVAMSSSYFDEKVEVRPDLTDSRDVCVQRNVSFRTETRAQDVDGESYSEWMLKCSVKPLVDDAPGEYFVSRAYQSHYVVIYSQKDADSLELYVESISGNVGAVVERNLNTMRTREDEELPVPDLKLLLEESRIYKNEESVGVRPE